MKITQVITALATGIFSWYLTDDVSTGLVMMSLSVIIALLSNIYEKLDK